MTLQEILKSQNLTDEQVETVIGEMKQNKIFTSSEENIDIRFGKLKQEHEALTQKDAESQKLIADLQKASKDNEGIQTKIAEYEATIKNQQEELERTKTESALKVALLGAKAVDIDYLSYQIQKNQTEIKLDDDGNIKGFDNILAGLKTQFPTQFEVSGQNKVVDEHKLGDDAKHKSGDAQVTKEQFDKMGYKARVQLKESDPELYTTLSK